MREAFSRLSFLLEERGLTSADLVRQIRVQGDSVDPKTIQRLVDPDRPVRQVETRVADAICRALDIEMGELLVFAEPLAPALQTLPEAKQRRLDELMGRHAAGQLDPHDLEELRRLVEEAEQVSLAYARLLIEHRRQVREASNGRRHPAAD